MNIRFFKENRPILILSIIILIFILGIITYSFLTGFYKEIDTKSGIFIELHGLIFEIIIIGILFSIIIDKINKISKQPLLTGFYKDLLRHTENVIKKIIQLTGESTIKTSSGDVFDYGSHIFHSEYSVKEIGIDKTLYNAAHKLAKELEKTYVDENKKEQLIKFYNYLLITEEEIRRDYSLISSISDEKLHQTVRNILTCLKQPRIASRLDPDYLCEVLCETRAFILQKAHKVLEFDEYFFSMNKMMNILRKS